MSMRQTVDNLVYSDDFAALVLAEYPNASSMHAALRNNSYMLGRWLDDSRHFEMSPEQIAKAFRDGREQDVLKAAETSIRRSALYAAWDRQVFTQNQDGSPR